ncbi:MAG: hypothetical protein JST92_06125, partial [Deltaproteobacteria bacterium]|nr:hypothetical protein [Deltaproteobacteria bacterium]
MLRTRPLALAIALCLPALLCATAARADRRTLIRGYEYATQPQGNLELEIWNELDIPRGHASDIALTQRIELEYGITDHWDVALYHVFADQGSGESRTYGFDSWRLEQRYRLLEKGDLPVDLMLYLEIERPRDFTEPWIFEGKLIAERELGKLGLVGNLIFERGASTAGEMNFELDLGAR